MAIYYCDGSTYRNGQSGQDSSYLVLCPNGQCIREHIGDYSINVAELSAILHAVTLAAEGDIIYSDSQIAVNWVMHWKKTKVNGHVEREVKLIQRIITGKDIIVQWVSREQNLAGKEIECTPFYRI